MFIGYSAQHKGVKCLDVSTGRVYISRDVVFDETKFPFADLHPNAGALLRKEILLLPSHLTRFDQGGNNCDDQTLTNPITVCMSFVVIQMQSAAKMVKKSSKMMKKSAQMSNILCAQTWEANPPRDCPCSTFPGDSPWDLRGCMTTVRQKSRRPPGVAAATQQATRRALWLVQT